VKPEFEGMNRGQRAMHAVRTARPGYSNPQLADAAEVGTSYIGQARTILKRSPELADKVSSGELGLTAAYARVKVSLDAKGPVIDRARSSVHDIAIALDPEHVLADPERADLASRLHALYRDEEKIHRQAAERIEETRSRRTKLAHEAIKAIKSMSAEDLERFLAGHSK
jgi:hypothetical protein